ncbi:MAG: hypothetical protein ACM3PV_06325, partial [Betaproteobacteria bacterium]
MAFSPLRKLLALLLLGGWVALLQTQALQPSGVGAAVIWDLRSLAAARASLGRVLLELALAAARFAPLGTVAVFAFRDRSPRLLRAVLVGLPAFVLGLAAAAVAVWLRDRAAGPPGPSDLLPAALGVGLGVLVGLSWRRGIGSLLLLPLKLAAAAALLALLVAGLLAASLEPQPALGVPRAIRTEDKRHLVAVFRGKDPRTIPPGETRTLRLEQDDAERLVGWGLPLVHDSGRVRAAVAFEDGDRVALRASARVPLVGRWLNLDSSTGLSVRQGRLFLWEPRARLGRRQLPAGLMGALAPALQQALRAERPLRPVLSALRELKVERGALSATYGRMETPPGLVASLVWGEGAGAALREPLAAQVAAILDAASRAPRGDGRFARACEAAFGLARERSREGGAVEENRAAILGLGIVLGSSRLAPFVGDV